MSLKWIGIEASRKSYFTFAALGRRLAKDKPIGECIELDDVVVVQWNLLIFVQTPAIDEGASSAIFVAHVEVRPTCKDCRMVA